MSKKRLTHMTMSSVKNCILARHSSNDFLFMSVDVNNGDHWLLLAALDVQSTLHHQHRQSAMLAKLTVVVKPIDFKRSTRQNFFWFML